jgi:GTPase-activating protein SAC7
LFSSPGNAFNVSQLKEMFNQSPMYGENFEFEASDYTVYDAARLIILYLEELPKPLISSSVIRSWVQLARQEGAIEPPAPRVETGLDFWTEALNRLPTASRNLTKHLLSLFADILIAKAGEVTEVDARHLASAVSRALFHQDTEPSVMIGRATSVNGRSTEMRKKANKKNAHPTLALAFLIKKRGEYAHTLKKATGMGDPNHKGVKKDPQFLPSTREMLDWKNASSVKA